MSAPSIATRPTVRNPKVLARPLTWLLVVVVIFAVPYGLNSYDIHVANIAVIFAIIAVGEGIALGVGGQVNLAQSAFFGLAAYVEAMLTVNEGWTFWPAAAVSLAVSILAGAVVGIPALRIQSHYLGIITLGLALGFASWTTTASYTGGANGISGIPTPPLFGFDLTDEYYFFWFAGLVFLVMVAMALLLVRGRHGRRMRAMRDDSLAAGSLGVNASVLRMTSFVVASFYGGIAGILYAALISFVSPDSFNIGQMFLILAMVIIGGRQSVVGCIVGAIGLIVVREALSSHATYAQLGYGLIVVLVVVFAPTGLAGVPVRVRDLLRLRLGRVRGSQPRLQPFVPLEPTDRSGCAVDIDNIGISFRGLRALEEVSLQVPANQIRGLVGPNGSGKTTLFNIISGLYRPSDGTVTIDGERASRVRSHVLARRGMARTFQNLRLFGSLTVKENVMLGCDDSATSSVWRWIGAPLGERARNRRLSTLADDLLVRYGLQEFADAHPGGLPYGIQRRVEICRAMARRPSLLLLDEPAAGLNGDEIGQLKQIVTAIRDAGTTVLIVEHNMAMMMSLCDQVTVLSNGRVIADGDPATVVADPAVVTAYLGVADMTEQIDTPQHVELKP